MDFTLKPRTAVNLRDWHERQIIGKRNRDEAVRQAWDSTAQYFRTQQVNTTEYEALASAETYKSSMEAYELQKHDAAKQKNLEERRRRLRKLLQEENAQYEVDVKEKEAQEVREKPRLCLALVEPATVRVPQQPRLKLDILPSDRGATIKPERPVECLAKVELHDAPKTVASNSPCPITADMFEDLVRKARQAESESAELKLKQKNLEALLVDLEYRADLRRSLVRKQGTETLPSGKYVRPYKVLLQMRGRHIVECLEFDLMLLNLLMKCLKSVVDVAVRKQISEDLEKIRKYMSVRLKKEQLHLEFVERLFQEEAEQVWLRKISEWLEECKTRDAAIDKIMRMTEIELQKVLTGLLESLQENILLREDFVSKIEAARLPANRQLPEPVLQSVVEANGEDRRRRTDDPSSSLRLPYIDGLRLL